MTKEVVVDSDIALFPDSTSMFVGTYRKIFLLSNYFRDVKYFDVWNYSYSKNIYIRKLDV